MAGQSTQCKLCRAPITHNDIVYQNDKLRIEWSNESSDYPLYLMVIWQAHVAEMTGLSALDRDELMRAVWNTEKALSEVAPPFTPLKINLASLGNIVPHLHWHIIARYGDDAHFPASIWGTAQRPSNPHVNDEKCKLRPLIESHLIQSFDQE